MSAGSRSPSPGVERAPTREIPGDPPGLQLPGETEAPPGAIRSHPRAPRPPRQSPCLVAASLPASARDNDSAAAGIAVAQVRPPPPLAALSSLPSPCLSRPLLCAASAPRAAATAPSPPPPGRRRGSRAGPGDRAASRGWAGGAAPARYARARPRFWPGREPAPGWGWPGTRGRISWVPR